MKHPLVLWLGSSAPRRVETASVRGLGIRERMPAKMISRPGGTDDYLFMHFYDPVGISVAGGIEYVPPHSFIIWEPKAPHLFGDTQRRWNHSWIHCSGTAIVESLAASGIEPNHPIPLSGDAVVNRYLPAVYDEIRHHSEPDPVILGLLFATWLREVERDRDRTAGGSSIPANLLSVKRFIETRLAEPIRLEDLAAQAMISASRLSAQFKRYFHTSPIDYVLRMRLRRASYLLLDQNRTVSQVATEVGFSDAFYFSRQFKNHYGVSPIAYRRQVHSGIA